MHTHICARIHKYLICWRVVVRSLFNKLYLQCLATQGLMNLYCKMLMHVPCTRCVELPWGGANSLPSDDFPFPWVGFVSSQSAVLSSSRTSKALQWSSAAWALKRERERDQLHVSRSFFVQLIYSDKTPTLKSSIFLIVTLNASLSSGRFNCFYVSCFQGLPPVNRTCFSSRYYNLRPCQITEHVYAADLPGRSLGTYVRKLNREKWGPDVLRIQWWVWENPWSLTACPEHYNAYLLTIPTVPAIVKCWFFWFFSVSQMSWDWASPGPLRSTLWVSICHRRPYRRFFAATTIEKSQI